MTPGSLVAELCDRGVTIEAAGGELRLNAPTGAITPDLLAAVKNCKSELLELLTETAGRTTYADHEWGRFLRVAVPARDGGLRDPAEPILERGVSSAAWDAFVRDCGGLGRREG